MASCTRKVTNGDSRDAINHCHSEENEKSPTYVLANASHSHSHSRSPSSPAQSLQAGSHFVEMGDGHQERQPEHHSFPHVCSDLQLTVHTRPGSDRGRAAHPWALTLQTTGSGRRVIKPTLRPCQEGAGQKGRTAQVTDGPLCSSLRGQRTCSSSSPC